MKELSRKFSADENDTPTPSDQSIRQPERDGRPVCHDLRFVVKESLNLGFRFFDEVDRMLQKFREEEPEKKPESHKGEEKANDPS